MQLAAFSVRNYRSITSAQRLSLRNPAVLIGRNNEGKSNLLNALVIATELTQTYARGPAFLRIALKRHYDWDRDFPIALQSKLPSGKTTIQLRFSLNEAEILEFTSEIKSKLNGDLPLEISIDRGGARVTIPKKGRGAVTLNRKLPQIAKFIGSRLSLIHIPAVRTSDSTQSAIAQIVQAELETLEGDEVYLNALGKIAQLQEPVLAKAAEKVTAALKEFLPQVQKVEIRLSDASRVRGLRSGIEILINDGVLTPLNSKGDGIKSLAAIGLLKGSGKPSGLVILALEEPEIHLHPGAIHQLHRSIAEISESRQVVLTTHSPLLINREHPSANIIVSTNQATSARSLSEIRKTLEMRLSDNLVGAEIVVLVEGTLDRDIIVRGLSEASEHIKLAMKSNTLVVEALNGCSKLSQQAKAYKNSLCNVHVFFDNDDAGRTAIKNALSERVIEENEYQILSLSEFDNAELEDIFVQESFGSVVLGKYEVEVANMKPVQARWSVRIKNAFKAAHKIMDDEKMNKVKSEVCNYALSLPTLPLTTSGVALFKRWATVLEDRLK